MSKFKITVDGKTYEVNVNETDLNAANVEVNGTSYAVEFESEETVAAPVQRAAAPRPAATAAAAPAAAPRATGGDSAIKSPLPGTILTVNVKTGDAVKKGDVLLVMEAMKMENNIMASKDGVVGSVYVAAGQTVMQEDALIDIN